MRARRVVVVGGGPAGMMAAGQAALAGAKVVLLEKGPNLGRKLRITGKGRCNITNSADLDRFIQAFHPNGKFLYGPFSQFFRTELLEFIAGLGVQTKVERGGRVFPASDKAEEVVAALEHWLHECGVEVRFNSRAKGLALDGDKVIGVELFGGRVPADAVVLATGGASYPKTGSSGDAYAWVEAAGHTVVPPRPALSALRTREPWVRELAGLSLKNVSVSLVAAKEIVASEFGEMLFTHEGVSGPIILTLSRRVSQLPERTQKSLSIDLKPALSPEHLHARLVRELRANTLVKNYLLELAPKSLAAVLPLLADIAPDKPVNAVTAAERNRLMETLKCLRLTVTGMAPLEHAIVTAGGVALKEIDPRTMESKLVPGLYLGGEVVDLDAETGGYNIQAAFSMGYVAGRAAGRRNLK